MAASSAKSLVDGKGKYLGASTVNMGGAAGAYVGSERAAVKLARDQREAANRELRVVDAPEEALARIAKAREKEAAAKARAASKAAREKASAAKARAKAKGARAGAPS